MEAKQFHKPVRHCTHPQTLVSLIYHLASCHCVVFWVVLTNGSARNVDQARLITSCCPLPPPMLRTVLAKVMSSSSETLVLSAPAVAEAMSAKEPSTGAPAAVEARPASEASADAGDDSRSGPGAPEPADFGDLPEPGASAGEEKRGEALRQVLASGNPGLLPHFEVSALCGACTD